MKDTVNISEEEDLSYLDLECLPVDKSSFQIHNERTDVLYKDILTDMFKYLVNYPSADYWSVSRLTGDLNTTYLIDRIQALGRTCVEGRSWGEVDVELVDELLTVSNRPIPKDLLKITHNQNITINVLKELERIDNDQRKKV